MGLTIRDQAQEPDYLASHGKEISARLPWLHSQTNPGFSHRPMSEYYLALELRLDAERN